jgi:hypothetical protein
VIEAWTVSNGDGLTRKGVPEGVETLSPVVVLAMSASNAAIVGKSPFDRCSSASAVFVEFTDRAEFPRGTKRFTPRGIRVLELCADCFIVSLRDTPRFCACCWTVSKLIPRFGCILSPDCTNGSNPST